MRRVKPTTVAILLVAAATGLGACGGDDKGSNASTTTTQTTPTTTSTTKTTTTKKQSGNSKSGSGGGSNSGSKSKSGSSNKGTPTTPAAPTGNPTNAVPKPFNTSRTVCGTFLPNQIQRQLKRGSKTKESVARAYSKGYPEKQRSAAYKGCLAGLKKRR